MHDLWLATGSENKETVLEQWKNLRVFCEVDGSVVLMFS